MQPEDTDQPVQTHHAVAPEQQQGQGRTLFGPPEADSVAVAVQNQGTKDPEQDQRVLL